jgi:hypothetical protein
VTNLLLSHKAYTKTVMEYVLTTLSSEIKTAHICDFVETMSLAKELLRSEDIESILSETTNSSSLMIGKDDDMVRPEPIREDELQANKGLVATGESLMNVLASRSMELLDAMSPAELRRLLSIYALAPFRADEFIAAMEIEVEKRKKLLTEHVDTQWLDRLTACAVQASKLRRKFNGEHDNPLASIATKMKSFFRSNEHEKVSSKLEAEGFAESDIETTDKTFKSIIDFSRYASTLSAARGSYVDHATQQIHQGVLFELGRCTELINQYRTVDFESGKQTSRPDQRQQRVMTKLLLSRMMP